MPCGVCSCCEALEKPTAAPSPSQSPSEKETERRTWLMRWWNTRRGRWMRGITGSRVHHFNAYVIVCFHATVTQPLKPAYRWRSIHFESTPALSKGCPSQSATDCIGGGDELRRKAPLPVLEPGDRGKKKRKRKKSRFSMYVRCSWEP